MGSTASTSAGTNDGAYEELLVGDVVVVQRGSSSKCNTGLSRVSQVLRNGRVVLENDEDGQNSFCPSEVVLVPSEAAATRRRIAALSGAYESECERLDIAPHPTVREILNTAGQQARAPSNIDLSRQQLGDKDAIALSVVFKDLTRLESLDLSFNHIGVLGCKELARSLEGCQVDVLNLSNNLLEKEGLAEIAQCVRCRVLDASGNRVRATEGLAPLAPSLEELLLDDNPFTYLSADSFGALGRLRVLSACATGVNNLWTTVAALQRMPALQELRLQRPQPPAPPPAPSSPLTPAAAAAPSAISSMVPSADAVTPPNGAPSDAASSPGAAGGGLAASSDESPEGAPGPSSSAHWGPPSPPAGEAAEGPSPAGAGAGWPAAASWEEEQTPPNAAPGEGGEAEEVDLAAAMAIAADDGSDAELPDADLALDDPARAPRPAPPRAPPPPPRRLLRGAGRGPGGGRLRLLDGREAAPGEREAAVEAYRAAFEPLANGRSSRPSLFRLVALRELGARSRDTRPAPSPVPAPHQPPALPPSPQPQEPPAPLSAAAVAEVGALPLGAAASSLMPLPPLAGYEGSDAGSPSSAGNSPSCFPAAACFRRLRHAALPPGRLPRPAVPHLDPPRPHRHSPPSFRPRPRPGTPPGALPTGDARPRALVASAAPAPAGPSAADPCRTRRWGLLDAAGEAGACTPAGFQRSACAALQGSAWRPAASLMSPPARYRPRQFEYHPAIPEYMVFGTLSGDVVVVNHHTSRVIGQVRPAASPPHSILGLCWFHSASSTRFIAGSDNGAIQLYELSVVKGGVGSVGPGGPAPGSIVPRHKYQDFEQLTSVHVNATDDLFLASGYSNHVGLYDVSTGRRLQLFNDLHTEHINVLKFANHAPALFATSSFDRDIKLWDLRDGCSRPIYTRQSDRGNVMVCFSPDDQYLLASAIDNEVRQYVAADGRLHLQLDLEKTGSLHNYTRSYYMNGRDYIISGSCEESVVRVHCARTGRALRDVPLDNARSSASLYVQSLRGDPFAPFEFSVLVAYNRSSPPPEIVKISLLS
eukprot:tig00000663_g2961.t1